MKGLFHPLCWILLFTYNTNAQILKMHNGRVKISSALLFDSGGIDHNYENDEQLSLTICPEDSGKYIALTFLEFETEKEIDILTVINDSNLPLNVLRLSGQMIPQYITSQNKNGCIELLFNSDSKTNYGGFKIKVEQVSSSFTPNFDKSANNNCNTAAPFCASSNYNFPNSINQPAATGANFGCLSTRPNPAWYFMRIGQSGSIILNLVQTANSNGTGTSLDVDFAMWGPFSSTTEACNQINTNQRAPIQCSYSSSHQETIALGATGGTGNGQTTPANGQTGQIYMVLLTNYSNQTGYISFNQTGGTGTIDCSIISLSINLTSFHARNINQQNIISWSSIFSNFTSHYEVEYSSDGYNWKNLDKVFPNEMDSNYEIKHDNFDLCVNYYRLIEYNDNGDRFVLNTSVIDNTLGHKKHLRIVNTLGQDIDPNTPGLKIYLYEDGTSVKVMS